MQCTITQGDCLDILPTWTANTFDSLVTDPPAGISFMGQEWDSNKGGRVQWIEWLTRVMRECNRVLKPGAHALVWALPRTSHWTATAIEQAGFEVRDVVTHLFGTGFPKSHDISKAIDRAAGAERRVIGPDPYASNHPNPRGKGVGQNYGDDLNPIKPVTAPATAEAQRWAGWGTALKPAAEYWIMARKPLAERTVAGNVLQWGTGGLNLDGCRIGEQRRFPANLIAGAGLLGDEARFFYCPKASRAERNAGCEGLPFKDAFNDDNAFHAKPGRARTPQAAIGGARDRIERGEPPVIPRPNNHPTVKAVDLMRHLVRMITPPGGVVLDPFAGSGSTGVAALQEGFAFQGIELSADYCRIAEARLKVAAPAAR